MSVEVPIEYTTVGAVRGPLLVVRGTEKVGWDEVAEIRLESGEIRHGVVLDVAKDLAIVEVFEGTEGIQLGGVRIAFTGAPLQIPASSDWLGRICNGRGEPLDGGPPVTGGVLRDVVGSPINPALRATPQDPILTGVSTIDGLATLVRGQKLPIFSIGGLPHLELAAQIAAQATAKDEAFSVVVAAVGITHADASLVRTVLEERLGEGDLALFINTADDPLVERLVTPRIALTVAEHLAFDLGRHVLVVIADITSYCEAVREIAAARGDVPSRRGYPGYLYSDLASLYERAGRLEGQSGSLTQLAALTMPGGDVTHPVPDLTGYITEGQIVLSPELHARGVYPPVDLLGSLSRLMRLGAGADRTRADHLEVAAQIYAIAARARQAADLAEIVGEDVLSGTELRYLDAAESLEADLLSQRRTESRSLEETLERAWRVLGAMPRRELSMVSADYLDEYHEENHHEDSTG